LAQNHDILEAAATKKRSEDQLQQALEALRATETQAGDAHKCRLECKEFQAQCERLVRTAAVLLSLLRAQHQVCRTTS
jgi:hypothetical protein